jgi:hypothetical protein
MGGAGEATGGGAFAGIALLPVVIVLLIKPREETPGGAAES